MLLYTTRPLSEQTWQNPAKREPSRFTATWTETLDLLEREIENLCGSEVIIEVDVSVRHIRNDGMLRSDAKAASPAVVVAFETSRHGSLVYRCDRFERGPATNYVTVRGERVRRTMMDGWQHNVRAIALTLEALRAVDRYGASSSGEQYAGYRALTAGIAMPGGGSMTTDDAKRILIDVAGAPGLPTTAEDWKAVMRAAQRNTHPDANDGRDAEWNLVSIAITHLKAARVLAP